MKITLKRILEWEGFRSYKFWLSIAFVVCFFVGYFSGKGFSNHWIPKEDVYDAIHWRNKYIECQQALFLASDVMVRQYMIIKQLKSLEDAIKDYDESLGRLEEGNVCQE